MEKIKCDISGYTLSFDQAKEIGQLIAVDGNEYTMLISWCDSEKGVHSPHCLKCEFKGKPGWEVYGETHEGRLRIAFDDDRFVFIYS